MFKSNSNIDNTADLGLITMTLLLLSLSLGAFFIALGDVSQSEGTVEVSTIVMEAPKELIEVEVKRPKPHKITRSSWFINGVNPFGIKRFDANDWKGSIAARGRDERFLTKEHSVRALCRILYKLQVRNDDLESLILDYVHQDKNEIRWYIRIVSDETGISPDEEVNIFNPDGSVKSTTTLKRAVFAIERCETGGKFSLEPRDVVKGMEMYEEDFVNEQ